MPIETLIALSTFALVSSITPGPNNLMLMASGANFGMRRSLPHMLGVAIGFGIMLVIVGLGLAQIFLAIPVAELVLKVFSVVYMLYLAWKIANAAPPGEADTTGTPMTFLQAALFQWVNPKAWTMALTAMTAYAPTRTTFVVLLVAAVFSAINLPAISVWTAMGVKVRALLTDRVRLRAFNITMAVLLILSLIPVVFSN